MPNWLIPDEAMNYFGVDLEGLEDLILEYEIDTEVDDDGKLLLIDADDCKEPLFEEHAKQIGHRPDDWREHEKAEKEHKEKEEKEKQERQVKRSKLTHRVSMRGNE